jgi:hypothetical protein
MLKFVKAVVLSLALFISLPAQADECPADSTCVSNGDLKVFLSGMREKKCLLGNKPKLTLDPINVIGDQEGRVYFSGGDPKPYKAHLQWCNYDVDFEGKLNVVVAKAEPSVWGFRFRLKFAGSYLIMDAIERKPADGVDVGLLWDFFYWKNLNLNIATGFRSVGAGVGYDITKNFGVYGGYAFSFWTLKSNPQLGLYFGFW